jgi:hypothetical protein
MDCDVAVTFSGKMNWVWGEAPQKRINLGHYWNLRSQESLPIELFDMPFVVNECSLRDDYESFPRVNYLSPRSFIRQQNTEFLALEP